MNLVPSTLEGRVAWLLTFLGNLAGLLGVIVLLKVGAEPFQTMTAAKWTFPFALLSARLTGSFWGIAIFLLFLQFTIYAAALVVGSAVGRFRQVWIALCLAHLGAALLCIFGFPG